MKIEAQTILDILHSIDVWSFVAEADVPKELNMYDSSYGDVINFISRDNSYYVSAIDITNNKTYILNISFVPALNITLDDDIDYCFGFTQDGKCIRTGNNNGAYPSLVEKFNMKIKEIGYKDLRYL